MQGQRQVLAQQQRLALNPQLVQSIKLMGMSFADLRERILEEAEKNPALEIVRDSFETPQWRERVPSGPARLTVSSGGGDEDSDGHRDFIEGVLQREGTLQDRLLGQLGETRLPDKIRSLAENVVQNLDRDGFHVVPPEELPGAGDPAVLEEALRVVRGLDPVGCATRDFREALAVQARLLRTGHRDEALEAAIAILEGHVHLLEKGRPDALVKALAREPIEGLSVDLETAEDVYEIVRSLDPFPGRAYDTSPGAFVVPDVIVRKTEEGYSVSINDEEIPVLGVNPFFMELEGESGGDPESKTARDFAREQLKEARWFMGTIERRNLTILKLTRALVVYQRDFFTYGPARLAPLRMKDVAEEIGMHEATVSRAANGKYLQCEWGIFELRHFFSNQVGSARRADSASSGPSDAAYTAGRFSKEGVKEIVREIIEGADEALSDQKISDQLATRGIRVARRTVAKYRSELRVKSSFER